MRAFLLIVLFASATILPDTAVAAPTGAKRPVRRRVKLTKAETTSCNWRHACVMLHGACVSGGDATACATAGSCFAALERRCPEQALIPHDQIQRRSGSRR